MLHSRNKNLSLFDRTDMFTLSTGVIVLSSIVIILAKLIP